jgi:hypothetical protein
MISQVRIPLTAGVVVLLIAACQVPVPTKDTTPPELSFTVSGARGRNLFRSIDGPQAPPNNCIRVTGTPIQLIAIAGDAGGIQRLQLSVNREARIVPESVDVTPRAPEGRLRFEGAY